MLFIKGIYLLLSHLPTSHTIGGCLTPSSAITHRIAPSAQYIAKAKNRRRTVSYVSTGLACLPRDTVAHASTAEERLWKPEASKKRPMVGIPTIGLCIATFCCAITC